MIHPSLFQLCVCGHQRRDHIQHEWDCRPGFVCNHDCAQFVAPASPEEREKAIEDWKRVSEEHPISGPRSATEATELLPHPITEADFQKLLDWDPPTDKEVRDWINKSYEDLMDGLDKE